MCGEFPTEQQMAAFETELRNRILPSFETNFPGPNMRSEIARLRTKVVSGEVLLDMIRTPLNGTHALAAGLPLRDGGIMPVIYVSIPQLICANRLRGEDVMVAELAAYLVHEFYHAEHHLKVPLPEGPMEKLRAVRAGEGEAWLHMCTMALDELRENGYASLFERDTTIAYAYERCRIGRENPSDPRWQEFLDFAVGDLAKQ